MRQKVGLIAAIGIIVLAAAFWRGRAQEAGVPDFSGEWQLVSATGTVPPDGFVMQGKQSSTALQLNARWTEPKNGEYGLTLIGLTTPEVILSTDGREDLNQAGPFVLHTRTRWDGARLITSWNTSEFLGVRFQGQWVRFLSPDGHEMTIEIHATSSKGQHSEAALKFHKR
jgi:hypothetical protein